MAKPHLPFEKIYIIYNPNSTGDGPGNARELRKALRKAGFSDVHLKATKYAGHAEEIAYRLSKEYARPLLISASGDGGYHEVVNGAMRAKANGSKPICAVLPSGNANDHASVMQNHGLDQLISRGRIKQIDLLKISVSGALAVERYAHSYAGIGLTALIAGELNQRDLNPFNEKLLVTKQLFKYRPFEIEKNGRKLRLDSLLFANINRMAKVLTLSSENTPADGKFEVIEFPYQKKFSLLKKLAKSTFSHLEAASTKSYQFKVIKKTLLQADGEILKIPANSQVQIASAHKALETLY